MDDLVEDVDDPVDESGDRGPDAVVDEVVVDDVVVDDVVVDDAVAALIADGYATIPDAITNDQVDSAREELERILERTPPGRDDFEGRTRRVYALFAKTRALDALATPRWCWGCSTGCSGTTN